MRCTAFLVCVAVAVGAGPVLAFADQAPAAVETVAAPAPPPTKKRACSESFETGSLVKSHKSCRPVRKAATPQADAASPSAPTSQPAAGTP